MEDASEAQANHWDLEAWTAVFEYYQQDLSTYWVRSNFFLVIHGALFAFLAGANPADSASPQSPDAGWWRLLGGAVLGLLLAVVWGVVMHSGYKWIEGWRKVLTSSTPDEAPAAIRMTKQMLSTVPEPGAEGGDFVADPWRSWLRPAKVALAAPVLFAVAWSVLALWALPHVW